MKTESKWLTEKYTAKSGKVYQRYVLDKHGNKISKDGSAPVFEKRKKNPQATTRKTETGPQTLPPNTVIGMVAVPEEDGQLSFKPLLSVDGEKYQDIDL